MKFSKVFYFWKEKNNSKTLLLFLTIFFTLHLLMGCTAQEAPPGEQLMSGDLEVHFIDVGQADSILIKGPQGESLLIDAGENSSGDFLVNYLKSQGISKLDVVVATHPHADHIGGMDKIILNIPIEKFYMPKVSPTPTTRTYEEMLEALLAKDLKITQVRSGVQLDLPGITGVFLGPAASEYDNYNDYSAILKISYGNTSFLFTGDAESEAEKDLLGKGDLQATVLKVGHHGSNTSSTNAFLKAVSPEFAVIPVGKDNSYGHPHKEVLERLNAAGVKLYRTDQSGTIIAISDGKRVKFTTSSSKVKISKIDLRNEVVIIKNNESTAVDLSGWKLVSEVGNQEFLFPSGTIIQPGETLEVHSGKDAKEGPNKLIWGKENIWNNSGDPGHLVDKTGKIVSSYP